MAKTYNEEWYDANLRHQIFLFILSDGMVEEFAKILNASEVEVRDAVLAMAFAQGFSPQSLRTTQRVANRIVRARTKAWDAVEKGLLSRLDELAKSEAAWGPKTLASILPFEIDFGKATPEYIKEVVRSKPFEGKVLKDWVASLKAADLRRLEEQLKIGLVQGEDVPTITSRLIGTARQRGINGATQLTRSQMAGVVRTAVNHVGAVSREAFFDENADLFTEEQYVATLDSRTTPICRSLDGKRFPIGEGPVPPLHFRCRSLRVAVINGYAVGQRPAKPFTERQILGEFARERGFPPPRNRASLPFGTKGEYDRFRRMRVRQLTGQVPARTTYDSWLRGQSASFQDDILGPTRGRLFRRGGLKLDRFVNQRTGGEIPLHELARRERQAFAAAGMSPDAF